MARLNAKWYNTWKRGQKWYHLWQDTAGSSIVRSAGANAITITAPTVTVALKIPVSAQSITVTAPYAFIKQAIRAYDELAGSLSNGVYRTGPFYYNNNYYYLGAQAPYWGTYRRVGVVKVAHGTSITVTSVTECDVLGSPTTTGDYSVQQTYAIEVSNTLHVLIVDTSGSITYTTFNLTTETWGAKEVVLQNSSNLAGDSISLAYRETSGEIVFGYGGFYPTATAYYARRTGSGWSTGNILSTTIQGPVRTFAIGERVYLFYTKNVGANDTVVRVLKSDNTLSAEVTVASSASNSSRSITGGSVFQDAVTNNTALLVASCKSTGNGGDGSTSLHWLTAADTPSVTDIGVLGATLDTDLIHIIGSATSNRVLIVSPDRTSGNLQGLYWTYDTINGVSASTQYNSGQTNGATGNAYLRGGVLRQAFMWGVGNQLNHVVELTLGTLQFVSAGTNTVTTTAPNVTISVQVRVNTNTVQVSAPSVAVKLAIPTNTNTIQISAPTVSVRQSQPVSAGSNTLVVTSPTVTVSGSVSVSVNVNTITLTASADKIYLSIPVTTNTITITAPAVTASRGIAVTTNTITATAPAVKIYLRIPVTTNTITITAPAVTASRGIAVTTNTITITAAAVTASRGIAVTTNTITITAPAVTASRGIAVTTNTITATAPAVMVGLRIPVTTNTITITALAINVSSRIPVVTNSVTVLAPQSTRIATKTLEAGNNTIAVTAGAVTVSRTTLRIELRHASGTVLVADWEIEPTENWEQYVHELTLTEFEAISDWSDLQLWLVANGRRIDVAWARICTPLLGQNVDVHLDPNTITITAPSASVSTSAVTVTATVNTIVLSAPTATRLQTFRLSATTSAVQITAPNVTQQATRLASVTSNSITVTAPKEQVIATVTRTGGTNSLVVTTPKETVRTTVSQTTATNTLQVVAPTVTLNRIRTVAAGQNTITVSAPATTLSRGIRREAGSVTLTAYAGIIAVSSTTTLSVGTSTVSVTAGTQTVDRQIALTVSTPSISVVAPDATSYINARRLVGSASIVITTPDLGLSQLIVSTNLITITGPVASVRTYSYLQTTTNPITIFANAPTIAATIPESTVRNVSVWVVERYTPIWYAHYGYVQNDSTRSTWVVTYDDNTWRVTRSK